MKILSLLLLSLVLLVGCGKKNLDDPKTLARIMAEATDKSKLTTRFKNGEILFYAPNSRTPYTGWSKSLYSSGQVCGLIQYKDGKLHGLRTYWYENGEKNEECNFKDGKLHGLTTEWHENGQKSSETNYKEGKLHGLYSEWLKDGSINAQSEYQDGSETAILISRLKAGGAE